MLAVGTGATSNNDHGCALGCRQGNHLTNIVVKGATVDEETRCEHWGSQRDVVAFRLRCCGDWYACRRCHDEATDHETEVWGPGELGVHAVLCGACGSTMTIDTYLASGHVCPFCAANFNPGCRDHWEDYFELGK